MTSTEPAGLLPIELFILLLALATGVALVARRTAIPNSVALVVAGLALAVAVPGVDIDVTPELILAVLLPGWCSRRPTRSMSGSSTVGSPWSPSSRRLAC